MPQTSTGVSAGSAISDINPQCTVPSAGDYVLGSGLKTCADGIENQVATIKAVITAQEARRDTQILTVGSPTWTPPTWIKSTSNVDVLLIGSGGGGGSGAREAPGGVSWGGGSGG